MSLPVAEALELANQVLAHGDPPEVVDPASAADIVARFDGDAALLQLSQLKRSLPRLLTLLTADEMNESEPAAVADLLVRAGWATWPSPERAAVEAVFDAWWETLLRVHPHRPDVDVVLGTLAHLDLPLVRWLQPLLESLDGPGAVHLSEVIVGGLKSPAWQNRQDERDQVLVWCRSEPVVVGLTVVGGVHLAGGVLADVLDRVL